MTVCVDFCGWFPTVTSSMKSDAVRAKISRRMGWHTWPRARGGPGAARTTALGSIKMGAS